MSEGRDTLYIIEDEPPADRPRWYCHEHPHGFDDIDEAVAWALSHALGQVFYYAGEVPSDPEDADARPWPPPQAERADIDAAYQRAVASAAKEEEDRLAYLEARDAWLMRTVPELVGSEPDHRSYIEMPDGASIELEEFAGGSLCSGRRIGSGPVAFGSPADVLAGTTGCTKADPWLLAVVAALARERTWRAGRRQHLEVRFGSGELFHVTTAGNRDSIRRYGLDWTLMSRRGIAGSAGPELDAIFLCDSLEDAEFFTWMGTSGARLDVWGVRVDGLVVESGPDGWWIVNERIPPERLRLAVSDLVPKPPESTSVVAGWGYVRISRGEDLDA
jgi:hypothetical protein